MLQLAPSRPSKPEFAYIFERRTLSGGLFICDLFISRQIFRFLRLISLLLMGNVSICHLYQKAPNALSESQRRFLILPYSQFYRTMGHVPWFGLLIKYRKSVEKETFYEKHKKLLR